MKGWKPHVRVPQRLYICRRCQVITRRAQFELVRAQKRSHIVDGLLSAQQKLDRVVATIRSASDGPAASQQLQAEFGLSPEQVSAPTEAPSPEPSHVFSPISTLFLSGELLGAGADPSGELHNVSSPAIASAGP